ncbi:amidohydrolase family protein [Azospirillum sp. ST 5-10]|uniref:amidohydrolase family protein n=1 Tax=unclassified Azospirillum TaxID=2630922 RepID=UPI003F4A5D28
MTAPDIADLVLHGATVLTADPARPRLDDAVIVVRGGRLAAVEPRTPGTPLPPARRTLDLTGHLVTPGFVNVHTHAILTMVRGVAEDMGFAPAYTPGVPHGHEVTPDEAVALARLGALEALLFGSTLINDSYVHADRILPAMGELGLRVVACGRIHDVDFSRVHEGVWEHRDAIGAQTLGEAVDLHTAFHGAMDGRLSVHLTPHAPDTCSAALLGRVREERDRLGVRVNTHLSQSRLENERIAARDGRTPTELLDEVGLLDHRLTAAHCMHVTDDDIRRIGAAGVSVAHVPKGNATGGRIAPTAALRAAGANLALATDNMHADMIEVMRWALNVGRVQAGRIDDVWQSADVFRMATMGGAEALGMEGEIGSLEVGKRADLVAIDLRRPHLVPVLEPLGTLVHTAQGRDVVLVVVDGRVVVEDGRAVHADTTAILADAQRAAEALWARARASVGRTGGRPAGGAAA